MGTACDSGAMVAWLVGSEGVGKSTLARHASEALGRTVHRLDVYPEDRSVSLSVATELACVLGVELGPDPAQDLLRGLEAAGPVILLIEDAQWMDEASQLAIWQVARRLRRLPVFLIVTSTEVDGTFLDGLSLLLRSPRRGRIFTVRPLSRPEIAEFLKAELSLPIEGETLDLVAEATGGYPALLSSLCDQVRLTGGRSGIRAALRSITHHGRGSGLLRQHVAAVLAEATDSVSAALLALAQAEELSPVQLAHVLRLRRLPDIGIEGLLSTGLVERSGVAEIRLRHRLSGREISEHATWEEARQSHAALAAALTGLSALRHRVAAAGPEDSAAVLHEVFTKLGDAYAVHDLHLAFQLARQAARIDPEQMIEVVLAAVRASRPNRLVDVADDIENMAPSVTRTCALILLEIGQRGISETAERLQRLDHSEVTDPRELVVLAQASIFVSIQGVLEAAPEVGEGFAALGPLLHDWAARSAATAPEIAGELRLNAVLLEIVLLNGLNNRVPSRQRVETLVGLREQLLLDPLTALLAPLATSMIGILHFVLGNLSAARAELGALAGYDSPMVRAQSDLALSQIAFLDGDWDLAHRIADQQLAATLDSLQAGLWQQAFAVSALVPAVRGEAGIVSEYLGWQESVGVSNVHDALHKLTQAWALVAEGANGGELANLLDLVWNSGHVSYTGSYLTAVLRVRAHLAVGNRQAALEAMAAVASEPYSEPATAYVQAHCAGLLAFHAGGTHQPHFEEAGRLLTEQAAANPGASFRIYMAVLGEDWVAAAAATGVPLGAEGRRLLANAVDLLAAGGAATWSQRLASLGELQAEGEPEATAAPSTHLLSGLTSREREVALLVAGGLSNREIATRLFVTVRTAEYHVHNALGKMGMTSRGQLQEAVGGGQG